MVKAKEFWERLCDVLDYRFFSGVPCLEAKPLYDKMSPEFLHYIPAVNETSAAGMVVGAGLSGFKGAVLVHEEGLKSMFSILELFSNKRVPLLIIMFGKYGLDIPTIESLTFRTLDDLNRAVSYVETNRTPCVLFIEEEIR